MCGRAETAAQRAEVLKDFSRSSSSASSFASVVEETEGVDGDDTGLVRGPGRGVLHDGLQRGLFGRSRSLGVAEMRSGDPVRRNNAG